ncbi:hypothetical protein NPIL_484271 [Nephila pilipes]|uniref:Uncharacterized protein n=1 Tax=Nephila pilipes TaxID=299642 RepID=A0A8X6TME5_NEPPI|nr:hypothetical protein NPIL_484271 [Nephila pilipes]
MLFCSQKKKLTATACIKERAATVQRKPSPAPAAAGCPPAPLHEKARRASTSLFALAKPRTAPPVAACRRPAKQQPVAARAAQGCTALQRRALHTI